MTFDAPPARPRVTEADILAAWSRNLVFDPAKGQWRRKRPIIEMAKRLIHRRWIAGWPGVRSPDSNIDASDLLDSHQDR